MVCLIIEIALVCLLLLSFGANNSKIIMSISLALLGGILMGVGINLVGKYLLKTSTVSGIYDIREHEQLGFKMVPENK